MACHLTSPDVSGIDLSFNGLIGLYNAYFSSLPDVRQGKNTQYEMRDAAIGAFSVFFMQQPSFLAHQRVLEKKKSRSNAQSLFNVKKLPSDNHIRNLLDPLKPTVLTPIYHAVYDGLQASGHLNDYRRRSLNQTLLIALDGTQQLSSQKVSCKNCSTQTHKNGTVTYSHKAITPVIVCPGNSRVVSLPPEIILPQDGCDKQDSEHAAAKRWLLAHSERYQADHEITILGDDLYAHQPLCELLIAQNLHFIFTCKPGSHETLYEWVEELDATGHVTSLTRKRREGGKVFNDSYRFVHDVPLRNSTDALLVNWCEIVTTNAKGEQVYRSSFVTDHMITEDNVAEVLTNGRARWHIENGNNNTLKNHGYHLTHNFGHGKEHLASFLLNLNILAFLFHTVLQFEDLRYQAVRNALPSRVAFFDGIRILTTYMVFDHWEHLMEFMMEGLELTLPDTG